MEGAPDADHLELAAAQGWCIVTRNESDFLRLDASYQQRFVEHAGIIIVHQWRRLSIGAELRAFAAIEAALVPDEVRNRVEYLSRWVTT